MEQFSAQRSLKNCFCCCLLSQLTLPSHYCHCSHFTPVICSMTLSNQVSFIFLPDLFTHRAEQCRRCFHPSAHTQTSSSQNRGPGRWIPPHDHGLKLREEEQPHLNTRWRDGWRGGRVSGPVLCHCLLEAYMNHIRSWQKIKPTSQSCHLLFFSVSSMIRASTVKCF